MDTSEQNIKMCGKAVKIQELWEPVVGDYVALAKFPGQGFLLKIKTKGHEEKPLYQIEHGFNNQYRSELIWLPKQDQLWGMLSHKEDFYKINALRDWTGEDYIATNKGVGPCFYFSSMEQLLLAFVMREKYNLTWNGKDWV